MNVEEYKYELRCPKCNKLIFRYNQPIAELATKCPRCDQYIEI